MYPHVYEQLVSRVERFHVALAAGPVTHKFVAVTLIYVLTFKVLHQRVTVSEDLTTVHPETDLLLVYVIHVTLSWLTLVLTRDKIFETVILCYKEQKQE